MVEIASQAFTLLVHVLGKTMYTAQLTFHLPAFARRGPLCVCDNNDVVGCTR